MKNIELLKNNGIDVESSIQILGNIDIYDETLAQFLVTIKDRLNEIKQCRIKNDMPNYSILVHSLKSDSKYLGFSHLAELTTEHEDACNNNDFTFVSEHYNELMMEAVRVVSIIRQYYLNNSSTAVADDGKKTIIVADDSNIIRNFVNKVFSSEYLVLTAVDGHEVINIIEKNKDKKISGMLLDLNMPNFNGFDVLDYFQENKLFDKIPVSIITGDDTKDSIDKAFKYPIVDMLNKPFNESSVRKIVDKTISMNTSN